jgi:ABC-2 type transport system permease protein
MGALDLAVARLAFRRFASYRAATFAGIVTNTFFGTLLASVVITVVRDRGTISGYDEQDLVTQVWLTQGLLMTIAIWGWVELGDRVRSGEIAVDLARPVDLQRWWLAHDTGRAAYQALVRGTAPFLLASFFFDLHVPGNPLVVVVFVISLVLANTVSFALRYLVNLSGFWVLDVRGVARLSMGAWTALSGATVSLAFFPDAWEPWVRANPFAQMVQAPVDVWLGRRSIPGVLALQASWALALLALGRVVQSRAQRRAVVQGG